MATSASHSAVSRYRPAVIAVTGFAAAYAAYLVYCNLTDLDAGQPSTKARNLRRRNAVHRSRRQPQHSVSITVRRSRDALDSQVHCQYGSETYTHQLWGAPDPSEVASALRLDEPRLVADVIHDIETTAIEHLFKDLVDSGVSSFPDTTAEDLGPLVIALRRQDEPTIRELSYLVTHRYWQYNDEPLQEVIDRWCVQRSVESAETVRIEDLEGGPPFDEAETLANESDEPEPREPGQGIKGLLYHIAEEESRREAYVHRGTRCDSCGTFPIRGIRWHCLNCPDFDLCSTCEAGGNHTNIHVFAKIKIPIPTLSQPHHIQELWYPGDIRQHARKPEQHLIRSLARETGLEENHIHAYFEQFSCMVNAPMYKNDSMKVGAGIDRLTFEKALTSRTTPYPAEPNYLYERMFRFYDADQDGLISFQEWVTGLAYLLHSQKRQLLQRAPDEKSSLQRIFNGYDSDGDGYISRKDFLRLFRSKYAVHKAMILDTVAVEEAEPRAMGRDSANIIRSSQPISSVFTEADVPQGEIRRPRNKPVDKFGDAQVVDGSFFGRTVLLDQQSEMDNNFWESLFSRYGKPNRLADLHPLFDQSAEARLRVRPRYTNSEALPIDSNRDRFLVRTDTRGLRPYSISGEQQLRDEWRADIADARPSLGGYQTDGSTDPRGLEHILNRGQSYQVSAHERSFGNEVLYQVSEEAFNELLDPIFKEKEKLASQVRATQKERQKYRQHIEQFVKDKEAFRRELQQGSELDPLLAVANSSYMNGNAGRGNFHQLERHNGRQRLSAFEEAIDRVTPRNSGTPLQMPPDTAEDEVAVTRPQLPQDEVTVHLGQEAMVPTDEASLDDMETQIREQPLEELLRAAGIEIAGPATSSQDGHFQQTADVGHTEESRSMVETSGTWLEETTNIDPTLPQFRPNSAIGSRTADETYDEFMHLSPSRPATPTSSGHDSSATAISTVLERKETSTTAVDSKNTDGETDSAKSPQSPSASRLEFLAMLDVEEKQILERGGPGRLNVDELEEILSKDEAENLQPRLKGIVESWLEWALF